MLGTVRPWELWYVAIIYEITNSLSTFGWLSSTDSRRFWSVSVLSEFLLLHPPSKFPCLSLSDRWSSPWSQECLKACSSNLAVFTWTKLSISRYIVCNWLQCLCHRWPDAHRDPARFKSHSEFLISLHLSQKISGIHWGKFLNLVYEDLLGQLVMCIRIAYIVYYQ